MIAIPDSYVMLTCAHCGHTADLFDFCKTPITGELPEGTHQCPACRKAWRMEVIETERHKLTVKENLDFQGTP